MLSGALFWFLVRDVVRECRSGLILGSVQQLLGKSEYFEWIFNFAWIIKKVSGLVILFKVETRP